MEILETKFIIIAMKISQGRINSKFESVEERSGELDYRSVIPSEEQRNIERKGTKSYKSVRTYQLFQRLWNYSFKREEKKK